jgi:hypothetical protein
MSRDLKFCPFCKQDVIRDCSPPPGQPCFMTTIAKLANLAERVGLNVNDLLDLLNGGLSVGELLDVIGRAARAQKSPELTA